ncbi:MAG: hypothetical protein ACI9MF_001700, partial [Gammaproteobacteria bacterium]
DIWWCLRFCNSWGDLQQRFPESTLIVKYEELKSSPLSQLQRIVEYWQLELDESHLLYAINESSKEKMARKKDPEDPFNVTVIRNDKQSFLDWYDKAQTEYVIQVCNDFLKYDFGYDYKN